MTIAMCYLSPEGVVLGADSTSSFAVSPNPGVAGYHFFNNNQKLFELGENSTIGVLTWGLGGLTSSSHRTLLALLADDLQEKPASSVKEIANRWAAQFWSEYSVDQLVQLHKALAAKNPFDPGSSAAASDTRTQDEENQFRDLARSLLVGFCISGYVLPDRTPQAFEIVFQPLLQDTPAPKAITGIAQFWGAPNMIQRLIFGADDAVRNSILTSGKWIGTAEELGFIVGQHTLAHPVLPIRDAIDFVYTCIYSTIKAMKFSNLFQICGGAIELAVITSDRRFRWVRHKRWDAAIGEE